MQIRPFLELFRINHWYKNITVFFGIIFALIFIELNKPYAFYMDLDTFILNIFNEIIKIDIILASIILVFIICLISSSNYIVNAICDIKHDRLHPKKKKRPLPSKKIKQTTAFTLFIVNTTFALIIAYLFNIKIFTYSVALLIAGLLYNIKPIRLKDVPFIDVISESVNNPIRFLIGWYLIMDVFPNMYILLLTWTMGAMLMTLKRYLEFKEYDNRLVTYRQVFKYYRNNSLVISMLLYLFINIILTSLFLLSII